MSKNPPIPGNALHSHALPGTEESTAMRAQGATKVHHAALLISAIASLITALTGVAVLFLHYS